MFVENKRYIFSVLFHLQNISKCIWFDKDFPWWKSLLTLLAAKSSLRATQIHVLSTSTAGVSQQVYPWKPIHGTRRWNKPVLLGFRFNFHGLETLFRSNIEDFQVTFESMVFPHFPFWWEYVRTPFAGRVSKTFEEKNSVLHPQGCFSVLPRGGEGSKIYG